MEEGITEFPDKLKNSKDDANTYLDSTKKQANHLLDTNYDEFKNVFQTTINSKYLIVIDKEIINF